jgi:hypothetical protein
MLIWQLLASLQERERELAVNLHGLVRQKKNDGKTMGKPWENCDLYGKSPNFSSENSLFLWPWFQ